MLGTPSPSSRWIGMGARMAYECWLWTGEFTGQVAQLRRSRWLIVETSGLIQRKVLVPAPVVPS